MYKKTLRDPVNLGFGLGFPLVLLFLLSSLQANIIGQHTIMCQSKGHSLDFSKEWVIVLVLLDQALHSHSSVGHDYIGILENAELHPVGRQRLFFNNELSPGIISIAGSINAAGFTDLCQNGNGPCFLYIRQLVLDINKTKEATHYTSSSLSTGSLM